MDVFRAANQYTGHHKPLALSGRTHDDVLTLRTGPWKIIARSSMARGVMGAVRDSAFPVLHTEFVSGLSVRRTESMHGVTWRLTSVFLTVE